MKPFPLIHQLDAMDCGPACLRMVAKFYRKNFTIQTLRERSFITHSGVSMLGISDAAESIGLRTIGVKINFEQLVNEANLPCILHWNQSHFVVLYNIKKSKKDYIFYIADPAGSKYEMQTEGFLKCWASSKSEEKDIGTVLLLEPSPNFYTQKDETNNKKSTSLFLQYLFPYKSQFLQLLLALVVTTIISTIFPFLTQSIVDKGISNNNLSFVTLVLISQLVLFSVQLGVNFLQSWISLHVNTRISISLISDFLSKLMRLPLRFFDSKNVGDIMQRIGDNDRIKNFLTGSSITTLFSFFNFIVFACILAYYSTKILTVFLIGNALYILWITLFLRYRRRLDMARFTQAAAEQSNLVQIVTGMQEIKLNNCEKQQRWKWERIQVKLFNISIKGLALGQYQQLGSVFFTQVTTLLISYISARSVIEGNMTLGMMMSVSYIIGQLSGPIGQVIGFVQSAQDAKISLERLNEIHNKEDETVRTESEYISELPENKNIIIDNVYFSYDGAERDYALNGVSLFIPQNKTTAIVGASGSGKTTLIKLLLGFYKPNKGEIYLTNGKTHESTNLKNGVMLERANARTENPFAPSSIRAFEHSSVYALSDINPQLWRQSTGAVMQDGFIFSDTIANNIAVGVDNIDKKRLKFAAQTANIHDFIESLPLKYNTKIGMDGSGISQGQRQRLLIARAVYKNPDFLFFDEATNALDANNERVILDNLKEFYKGKTVVIVAHRLSTVQNADKIVVMDNGKIAEHGTHAALTEKRGLYYNLVKNQLELGN